MTRSVCRRLFRAASLFLPIAAACQSAVSAEATTRPALLVRHGRFDEWADGKPAGWDIWGRPQKVAAEAKAGPAGAPALRVDVKQAYEGRFGQIRQSVRVKPDTWYRVQADIRSSADDIGFVEVKRIVDRKEIERISTSRSTRQWATHSKAFCSGQASKLDVGMRFRQGPDQLGQSVWFANVRLMELPGPPPGIPGVSEVKAPPDIVELEPRAVPTFECVGLQWRTREGSSHNPCRVRYRAKGSETWREAMDLWFDPNKYEAGKGGYYFGHDDQRGYEYRGSIVGLTPGTTYEVELTLNRSGTKRTLTFTTWSEQFRVKAEREVSREGDTFTITKGGSAEDGYVVYRLPRGTVRTSTNKNEPNVLVKAPYVILRGLTLVGGKHGIELGDVHHVVVEDCDIRGWGRTAGGEGYGENMNAAVYAKSDKLEHIVVQRCNLHHPATDANSWLEERVRPDGGGKTFHPMGPQGIAFRGGRGRYVIRYNRIHSDWDHMFNDGMGETRNFSFRGFPCRDSDIYGNRVSHCWDDGLEIEGANINVRVWGNVIDNCYVALASATTSQGPLYMWRNVAFRGRKGRGDDESYKSGPLLKLGNENVRWGRGRIYFFHNTIYQVPALPGHKTTCGMRAGIICTGRTKRQQHLMSRNNILHVRTEKDRAIYEPSRYPTNDFDYDMSNGRVDIRRGQEKHLLRAVPTWAKAPDGRLWLRPGTPGHDQGVRLPNFNDDYEGKAPDLGAVETNSKPARVPLKREMSPTN